MTSRIDKDLKVELRETAFNMWMACYDNQEIADTIGYSRPAISEFVNFIRNVRNGTGAENDGSSEKPPLAKTSAVREFDEERKQEKALAMWLACHTQEEIAEAVDVDRSTISKWEEEFVKLSTADIFTNFTPPHIQRLEAADKDGRRRHLR